MPVDGPVQDDAHISFAKRLAHNNKDTRQAALKKLKRWLVTKSKQGLLDHGEIIKIWKGLHYSMWFSDKMLTQESLALEISQIMSLLPDIDDAISFFGGFCETIAREWVGIDRQRLDKFYMFIKTALTCAIEFLAGQDWDDDIVSNLVEVLDAKIINSGCPDSIPVYIAEQLFSIYSSVSSNSTPTLFVTKILTCYITVLSKTPKKDLSRVIMASLFVPITSNTITVNIDLDMLTSHIASLAVQPGILTRNRKLLYRLRNDLTVASGGDISTLSPLGKRKLESGKPENIENIDAGSENIVEAEVKPAKKKKKKVKKRKTEKEAQEGAVTAEVQDMSTEHVVEKDTGNIVGTEEISEPAEVDDNKPAEVVQAETEVAQAETEVAQAETEVAQAETEVAQTETDVAQTETEVSQTETEVAEAETEVAKAETEVAQTETEVAQTETEVAQAETEVAQAETEVAKAETEVAQTETEVAQAETEVEEVTQYETVEATQAETVEVKQAETVEATQAETEEATQAETVEATQAETVEASQAETVEATQAETVEASQAETEVAQAETEVPQAETVESTQAETEVQQPATAKANAAPEDDVAGQSTECEALGLPSEQAVSETIEQPDPLAFPLEVTNVEESVSPANKTRKRKSKKTTKKRVKEVECSPIQGVEGESEQTVRPVRVKDFVDFSDDDIPIITPGPRSLRKRRKKSLKSTTPTITPSTTPTTVSDPTVTAPAPKKKVKLSLENNETFFFKKNASLESPKPFDSTRTPIKGVLKMSPALTRSQARKKKTKSRIKP